MDWIACRKNKNLVKEVSLDRNLINSLLKSSSNKEYSQRMLIMDSNTASSKVSLAYDALRELLEATALIKGYKIYNHECYTCFLKEELGQSSLGDELDKFRRIRNSINYYGKDISPEEAQPILDRMKIFMIEIKKLSSLKQYSTDFT